MADHQTILDRLSEMRAENREDHGQIFRALSRQQIDHATLRADYVEHKAREAARSRFWARILGGLVVAAVLSLAGVAWAVVQRLG